MGVVSSWLPVKRVLLKLSLAQSAAATETSTGKKWKVTTPPTTGTTTPFPPPPTTTLTTTVPLHISKDLILETVETSSFKLIIITQMVFLEMAEGHLYHTIWEWEWEWEWVVSDQNLRSKKIGGEQRCGCAERPEVRPASSKGGGQPVQWHRPIPGSASTMSDHRGPSQLGRTPRFRGATPGSVACPLPRSSTDHHGAQGLSRFLI